MKKKIIRSTTIPASLNTFCNGVLHELSEKYEVIGLSSPGEELQIIAEREGVRVIEVPMERHISLWNDFKSLLKLIRVFRVERPEMVHSMTPKAGMLCMLAAWLVRVPVRIHTFTGLVWPTETGFKRKLLMFTDKITCFCATHIIPEGEGVKNDLLSNGITKKPLRVLGYGNVRGVDMNYYSRRPDVEELAEKLRDDKKFTFVFVGRIVRAKGINELCKAFHRLHERYPQTRCWLVGPFEDNLDPISKESREIIERSDSGIVSVGPKSGDELLAFYAAADCFVFPSYREGFPNTVLEAGAMGLSSIVTDINGSREIIKEGENGMVIPVKDENALVEAMIRMVEDKDGREQMALNARKMVENRYEQGFVRSCLYKYYEDVMNFNDEK